MADELPLSSITPVTPELKQMLLKKLVNFIKSKDILEFIYTQYDEEYALH